jgi:predicted ATPase
VLARLVTPTVPAPGEPGPAQDALFVDLSTLTDPALAVEAIAAATGMSGAGGDARAVARGLARPGRSRLLVLDGAERVAGLDGFLAEAAAVPGLTVLVTSRTPLRAPEERRYSVRPLDTAAAMALFVDRARSVSADFALGGADAGTLETLCQRLGGLPLAVELAAAQTSLLPVPALLERMDRSLQVLVTAAPVPDRHRSLRATLDWSHDLLDPAARRMFGALSVFHGGCTIDAAERVCGGLLPAGADLLGALSALVDSGMLARTGTVEPRLTMLDTVHEYARDRLDAGGDGERLRDRHLGYFLELAERHSGELSAGDQARRLAVLEADHDNLRAALERAADRPGGDALRLALALWPFWYLRGHLAEGRRALDRALRSGAGAFPARAEALRALAVLAFAQGDLGDAAGRAEQAAALFRAAGDRTGVAHTLNSLGNVARDRGEHSAAAGHYDRSLALYQEQGRTDGVAAVLNNLGTTAYYQRDLDGARHYHERSLRLRQRAGDTRGVANCLDGLALVARESGDLPSALAYGRQALALREELGDRHGTAVVLLALAATARADGQPEVAAEHARQALETGRTVDDPWITITALATLAGAAADTRDWPRAAGLAGAAALPRARTGVNQPPTDAAQLARDEAAARAALGDAAYTCAWDLGRSTPPFP